MEDIISGTSAFRLYRTPPRVLALYDGLPVSRERSVRIKLAKTPLVEDILGSPLYVLTADRKKQNGARKIKRQYISSSLPYGSTFELEGFGKAVSPGLTLLTMARQVSFIHLVMAAYELCGQFSVFKMPGRIAQDLDSVANTSLESNQWRQVFNSKGLPTELWQRPPLITIEELHTYVEACRSVQGATTLKRALRHVVGITRSPFEVQTAMLLNMPRVLGGRGLKIETNKRIILTRAARNLAKRDTCYADIYIESSDGNRALIVECQGATVHAGESASISDANRTTALEAMGYDVVLLTYNHILYPENFESVVKLIYTKLGMKMLPRNHRMLEAEKELRRELFIDWLTLGTPSKSKNRIIRQC